VDTAFGTALRTSVEVILLTGLLFLAARMVRIYEKALRATERKVRHQATQLSAFLDTAAIGLRREGPTGEILWANEAELAMLGYAREGYVGQNIAEFHSNPSAAADILERLHRGERLRDYAARLECADGSTKAVLIDSSALWEDGRFVHTQCFTR